MVCSPLNTYVILRSLYWNCCSVARIPVSIPIRILLPEPSAIVISDKHTILVCVISKVYTESVTVTDSGICVIRLHLKRKISVRIKIKCIWIDKHRRICSRIVSAALIRCFEMQPPIFYCKCVSVRLIVLCPCIFNSVF